MARISGGELREMQRLAQESWRREPACVDVTLGELAYTWGVRNERYSSEWLHRLWTNRDEAVGWAWLFLPATLEWQTHPDHAELFGEILDWFESEARGLERAVSVRAANTDARRELQERGFRVDQSAPWMRLNVRELTTLDTSRVPEGFSLRTMDDVGADLARRVAVHQASWREFGTRVTEETYRNVTRTWPYRPDLDLIVEAPDGEFAAFALACTTKPTESASSSPSAPIRGFAASAWVGR